MSSADRKLLPLERRGFLSGLKLLLSKSEGEIEILTTAFQQKKTLFSSSEISRLLKENIDDAYSIRGAFLILVDAIFRGGQERVRAELNDARLREYQSRTSYFLKLCERLSKADGTIANFLIQTATYSFKSNSLEGVDMELSYTTPELVAKGAPVLLFPKIHLMLSTRSAEGQVSTAQLDFDADTFEVFILGLQENLADFRSEYKVLKRDLSDRFTSLISD